jgi:cytochrome b6-f complex iron-sulfur subunit
MTRKDFVKLAGAGVGSVFFAHCFAGCAKSNSAPTNVDFTLDVSTGALSKKGGYLVSNGVIVARTLSDTYIAVSVSCTHEGVSVQYLSSSNSFRCPQHGATFSSAGAVTGGPASTNLQQYKTELNGTSLHVFS